MNQEVKKEEVNEHQVYFFTYFVRPLEQLVLYGKPQGGNIPTWVEMSSFMPLQEAVQIFMEKSNIPSVDLDDYIDILWGAASLYVLELFRGELIAYINLKLRLSYSMRTFHLALFNFYLFNKYHPFPEFKEKLMKFSEEDLREIIQEIEKNDQKNKGGGGG